MLKRLLSVVLSGVLLLSLACGCSIENPDDLATGDVIAAAYARAAEQEAEQPLEEPVEEEEAESADEIEEVEEKGTPAAATPAADPGANQQPLPEVSQPAPEASAPSEAKYYDVGDYSSAADHEKYDTLGRKNSDGTQSGKDKYNTDPVPEGKPLPVESQDAVIDTSKVLSCTIEIRCDTILNNMDKLNSGKEEMVPSDGVIKSRTTVEFYQGESVFDVLQRVCSQNRIQMEFSSGLYNSAYIEGINNLYELDCGSLSGWMYSVDGWFPNYGCSRYQLQSGESILWTYTCDLGRDVGGEFLAKE